MTLLVFSHCYTSGSGIIWQCMRSTRDGAKGTKPAVQQGKLKKSGGVHLGSNGILVYIVTCCLSAKAVCQDMHILVKYGITSQVICSFCDARIYWKHIQIEVQVLCYLYSRKWQDHLQPVEIPPVM